MVGAEGTRGGLKRRSEILGVRDGRGVPEITAVISLAAGVHAGEAGKKKLASGAHESPAGRARAG